MGARDEALRGLREYREVTADRDRRIRAAKQAGVSISEISRETGISRPTVYEVLSAADETARAAGSRIATKESTMPVTVPETPHYFKVPGSHAMQAWRLDRAGDVLLTLTGFAAVDNDRESYVSVTVEGPGLEVSRASFTHPGDKHRAMKVDPAVQREVAEQVRGELLACLRDGTWEAVAGV